MSTVTDRALAPEEEKSLRARLGQIADSSGLPPLYLSGAEMQWTPKSGERGTCSMVEP